MGRGIVERLIFGHRSIDKRVDIGRELSHGTFSFMVINKILSHQGTPDRLRGTIVPQQILPDHIEKYVDNEKERTERSQVRELKSSK